MTRILCQITSQKVRDKYAIELDASDFETGNLKQKSNIRPNRIFTCDIRIILYRVGHLKPDKFGEVIKKSGGDFAIMNAIAILLTPLLQQKISSHNK